MWSPQYQKMGPPKHIKQREYHPTLEFLETQSNKTCTAVYEQDIANYLSIVESQSAINCAMIDLQPEIQWFMRPYLLDFLIEIHQSFRLHPQTLFLAVNIIDKYCSKRVVFKKHYQLVGCTALWLAAKYEDKKSRVPTLKELTIMCRNAYDADMFVQMEKHILSTLEWSLTHTSLEDCLQLSLTSASKYLDETPKKIGNRFHNKQSIASKIQNLARLFCELSLYERNFLQIPPSVVALACHLMASNIMGSDSASEAFEHAVTQYYSNHRELDDDATFEEDLENIAPDVVQPLLSGFSDEVSDSLAKIVVMILNTFSKLTQAVQNKYKNLEEFDYIKVVSDYKLKIQSLVQNFPETHLFSSIDEAQLDPIVNHSCHYILGLASSPYSSLSAPQLPFSANQPPLTPPSASSTISSVFSIDQYQNNYSNTSLSLTPNTSPMASQQRSVFYSESSNASHSVFKKPSLPSETQSLNQQSQPHQLHQVQNQLHHFSYTPQYQTSSSSSEFKQKRNKRQRDCAPHDDADADDEIMSEKTGGMNDSCPVSSPLMQRSQKHWVS